MPPTRKLNVAVIALDCAPIGRLPNAKAGASASSIGEILLTPLCRKVDDVVDVARGIGRRSRRLVRQRDGRRRGVARAAGGLPSRLRAVAGVCHVHVAASVQRDGQRLVEAGTDLAARVRAAAQRLLAHNVARAVGQIKVPRRVHGDRAECC